MLKFDSEATVVIKMLMRSHAQEKDWKSRETGKGSFVDFTGLVWLNFQLCHLWLCGFGPLEFGQCTTAQLNPERYKYIYIFNGCLDWWVMTLDSLGPCVTCCRQLALASTEAGLASSSWYFWWWFFFFFCFFFSW